MTWKMYALLSALFAALTAIFAKLGVSGMSSNLATFIRTFIILGVSAAFVTAQREWLLPASIDRRGLVFLCLSGVATGLSWLCYFRALQLGPVSQVAMLDKLSVVIVVIAGLLFFGDPFNLWIVAGATLVACGVFLLAS